VNAKNVYSGTMSDDEELLGICAMLRELHVRGYQACPGALTEIISEKIIICAKS